MNRNRKRYAKRIAGLTVATTLVLSAPIAPNVMSSPALQNVVGSTVAHAAADNLMDLERGITEAYSTESRNTEYGYMSYALHNSMYPAEGVNLRDISNLTYIVQLPNELSYWLQENHALNRLKDDTRGFMITGFFEFSDGNVDTINREKIDVQPGEFVTVDAATNSIKFDLTAFMDANDLKLQDGNPTISFTTPFALEYGNMPANGTYEVKTALVASDPASANIGEVNNPLLGEYVVEDTQEGEERVEDPEEPGDDDEDPEEP